jgi:hypothetical protein
MITFVVTDDQEPPSSRIPVVYNYPDMATMAAVLRENYAPEGELDDVPDDEVAGQLEDHYGLSVVRND